LLAASLLAGVVACASSPDDRTGSESRSTRGALVDRTEQGKIRTVVHGNPFDMDPQRRDALVTRAMAAGVSGLSPQFTVYPADASAPEPHLTVVLNPLGGSAATACRAPETIPTASAPETEEIEILAAFCDGLEPLGSALTQGPVSSPTDRRFERLLWRTSAELFPDDYWETYGFGVLPRNFDFGLGGSIGVE
jgi:hypothetical protein